MNNYNNSELTNHSINSDSMYLFCSLSIEPRDELASKIKQSINLSMIANRPDVLVNLQVVDKFKQMCKYCPFVNNYYVNTYYCEYQEQGHNISVLFYKVPCLLLLNLDLNDMTYLTCCILTAVHRNINIENNLLSQYDNYFNDCELKVIINKILSNKYNANKEIFISNQEEKISGLDNRKMSINILLNEHISNLHLTNLNRMIVLEKKNICEHISGNKLLYLPCGKIYDYTNNKITSIDELNKSYNKGGLVIENPNTNGVFQLLCLALTNTSKKTIIIVPEHLKHNWILNFQMYFNIELPKFITIVSRNDFRQFKNLTFDRVIIDEIHELVTDNALKKLHEWSLQYNCEHKWGLMSSTQYLNTDTLLYLLQFLFDETIYYPTASRFKRYYELYENIIVY